MANEAMVGLFDPVIGAFRDIPVSVAIKYIQEAKRLEKYLTDNSLATVEQING